MTSTTDTTLEILKQDRKGRVRTPRAKREAILDEYERSGISGPEFAQYLGIKYQTFATWVQKWRKGKAGGLVVGNGAVSWLEAEVGGEESRAGKLGLVVELAGGARFSVGDERGAILAATVLRHLGVGQC
jgi:transposase-like protein